jgi:hypothetical protein
MQPPLLRNATGSLNTPIKRLTSNSTQLTAWFLYFILLSFRTHRACMCVCVYTDPLYMSFSAGALAHMYLFMCLCLHLYLPSAASLAHTPKNTPNPALAHPVADAQLAKIGSKSLANKFKLHVDKYVGCVCVVSLVVAELQQIGFELAFPTRRPRTRIRHDLLVAYIGSRTPMCITTGWARAHGRGGILTSTCPGGRRWAILAHKCTSVMFIGYNWKNLFLKIFEVTKLWIKKSPVASLPKN